MDDNGLVTISHEGVEGTSEVTREAFAADWEALGWKVVNDSTEAKAAVPPPDVTSDVAPTRR